MFLFLRVGPVGRKAGLELDSAKVAARAFDSATALASAHFAIERDSLNLILDSAKANVRTRVIRTTQTVTNVHHLVDTLLISTAQDTSLHPLVRQLADSISQLTLSIVQERVANSLSLAAAESLSAASQRRITILSENVDSLRTQRDGGLKREAKLVRALRGIHFAVTLGPGIMVGPDGSVHGGVTLAVGLSKRL